MTAVGMTLSGCWVWSARPRAELVGDRAKARGGGRSGPTSPTRIQGSAGREGCHPVSDRFLVTRDGPWKPPLGARFRAPEPRFLQMGSGGSESRPQYPTRAQPADEAQPPIGRARSAGRADKPGSVPLTRRAATIHLGPPLPTGSNGLPTGQGKRTASRRSEERLPCLFGLSPGGVYRARPVTGPAVGSYPTVSPLPVPRGAIGGLFSVALSLTLRSVGVTHHPALRSPDFPRRKRVRRDRLALPAPDVSKVTPRCR